MGGYRVLMTGRGRYCIPTVYVDGRLAHRGTQTDRRIEPYRVVGRSIFVFYLEDE